MELCIGQHIANKATSLQEKLKKTQTIREKIAAMHPDKAKFCYEFSKNGKKILDYQTSLKTRVEAVELPPQHAGINLNPEAQGVLTDAKVAIKECAYLVFAFSLMTAATNPAMEQEAKRD